MSLDEFDRVKVVGKGSYGEVWLVRHKKDRKQYVLKKMNLSRASKRERTSAEQEAKLLSKLKHPNIVSYKDSFETREGYLYIAMQYCEGGDLYTKLKEQKSVLLEERQVVEWFVQIAMAMQYMHERNILHRDLKTQNIFLTKSKIIKVGDLGIARVLDSSNDMATTLIGTPYYMSPELFSNKPYNHKSDVWALGCCVYEMATLKHAFNAKDMNSLVYKILRGKMPAMPKQYCTELTSLIKLMLHQDPEKRPSVNRILRDPYIKKNIAIFLEDTKKSSRRPSNSRPPSASSTRPNSASSSRPSSAQSCRSLPPSNSSRPSREANSKPPVAVRDNIDSRPTPAGRDYIDSRPPPPPPVERDNVEGRLPPAARDIDSRPPVSIPVEDDRSAGDAPVVLERKSSHSRKPSDAGRPDLDPIHEKHEEPNMHSSSGSSESHDTVIPQTVKQSKKSPKKEKAKKESYLRRKVDSANKLSGESKPERSESTASVRSVASNHSNSSSSSRSSITPRPLPVPKVEESSGLPQKREDLRRKEDKSSSSSSKSSSVSSSKEDNANIGELETPRSLPNLSARERRRQKNPAAVSLEQPKSARIRLVERRSSDRLTKSEKSKEVPVRSRPLPKKPPRQPSIDAESSSSSEELTQSIESETKEKEKRRWHIHSLLTDSGVTCDTDVVNHREKKEMSNFISLLDTTLKMNKQEDKSDDDSSDIPSPSKVNGNDHPEPEPVQPEPVHKSSSMPSVETLTSTNRLMERIRLLQKDCVTGVGYDMLKKAYKILERIEDDEVEPRLVELLGKEKFDLYAGKIWQLKFCEESLFS
ncbi:serine/threonine-protein kinase Nek4-like [Haliotis asinina]|uniref:serine/threonine-protein kinase Nek4-like n=1 Tax=Haliotis asinina TaxID=109174 RepID=UPI003531D00F